MFRLVYGIWQALAALVVAIGVQLASAQDDIALAGHDGGHGGGEDRGQPRHVLLPFHAERVPAGRSGPLLEERLRIQVKVRPFREHGSIPRVNDEHASQTG